MADLSPWLVRGALVELAQDIGIVTPNIIPFQYNPAKVTRGLKPWNPFDIDPTKRGATAPMAAPFDPEETFSFSLEFDASDDLDAGNPIALATGIATRLAALQKLVMPTKGLLGDLVGAATALVGSNSDTSSQAQRSTLPVTLLILGPGVIFPVRITTLSIEISEYTPLLYPLMATVTLELRVLTPEVFKCKTTAATGLAKAAYQFTRTQEDALAILNIANVVTASLSMLPF